jgi:predicted secreted Zn-dependent protease
MRTHEEIADRVARRAEALIKVDYPRPQCATKQVQWNADITRIKKMVADRLGSAGITINVTV